MKKKSFEAKHFQETFSSWGTYDRRRRHSNTWHNLNIPVPKGYDYASLTKALHPDQDAYRNWCLDIMTHLLFLMASKEKDVRFLELGCADAHEVKRFLEAHQDAWRNQETHLQIHMLDDDPVRLKEAENQLRGLENNKIDIFLWRGRIEDLNAPETNYELVYVQNSAEKSPAPTIPENYHLIFSQLILHHYSLFELLEIFKDVYEKTANGGYFLFSDICYTGTDIHDAIIWNRVLLQIEQMPDQAKRDFWLNHYRADYKTYHDRAEIMHAMEIVGFCDVDMLQCMYDMSLILSSKI